MRARRRDRGFTVMEVLIALMILVIGMLGVVAMQKGAYSATSYSRHATEAAVLAEDKLEKLRTMPITALADDSDLVDANGVANDEGPFTREWTRVDDGLVTVISVTVTWEEGNGAHSITFRTLRNLD